MFGEMPEEMAAKSVDNSYLQSMRVGVGSCVASPAPDYCWKLFALLLVPQQKGKWRGGKRKGNYGTNEMFANAISDRSVLEAGDCWVRSCSAYTPVVDMDEKILALIFFVT